MRNAIAAAAVLLVVGMAATSRAQSIDTEIGSAQARRDAARARVDDLSAQVSDLHAKLDKVERQVRDATEALIALYQRQLVLKARLAGARKVLADRARTAYQVGPGSVLDVFLSVHSPSELASAQAYTNAAIGADGQLIARVQNAQAETKENRALIATQRKALEKARAKVADLTGQMEARLAEAEAAAHAADMELASLVAEREALAAAAARDRSLQDDLDGGSGPPSGAADWDAIAACESGGNWASNTGNGYWGGLQFAPETWFSYDGGPFSGVGPFPYSREYQIGVAERVLAGQGPGAWPICYRSA